MMRHVPGGFFGSVLLLGLLSVAGTVWAGSPTSLEEEGTRAGGRVRQQLVYVPVYSHIFSGDREASFLLAATVLVRNTDPDHSILVWSADYHDSHGKLLQRFLNGPVRLAPLATTYFVVPESDTAGGAGASVLVTWKAAVPVTPPLIESVMIGTRSQQGISFTSRGQVLDMPSRRSATASPSLTP